MIKNCELSQTIELKRLCLSSIQAAINRLIEVGAWPRPERARILMVGRDIDEEEFDDLEELKCLINFLASQELIQSMYLNRKSEKLSYRILRDHWLMFLLNILSETDGKKVEKRIFTKWFNRFAEELYCKSVMWRAIYVLDGVELNGNVLNLDKFTKIIPVSQDTLKSLIPWQSSIPWYDRYFNLSEIVNTKQSLSPSGNAILVTTKRLSKEYHGQPWPSGKEFDSRERAFSALAAIRLTQSGSVYMKFWGEFKVSRFRVLDPIWLIDEGQVIQGKARNKTFDFIKQLYDELRSTLVHGKIPKEKAVNKLVNIYMDDKLETEDEWKSGEIAVEITRDILRRSIEACSRLSKVKSPNNDFYWPFSDYFDTLMVVPGQQRKLQKIAGINGCSNLPKCLDSCLRRNDTKGEETSPLHILGTVHCAPT